MDPELLEDIRRRQALAAHAASQSGRTRSAPPSIDREAMADAGRNALLGLDPTFGYAATTAGVVPEREMPILQALTGLLSPAAAADKAIDMLRWGGRLFREGGDLAHAVRWFKSKYNAVDPEDFPWPTVEEAISGAPTEELISFDEDLLGFHIRSAAEQHDEGRLLGRLLGNRLEAELAARGLQGDMRAARAFDLPAEEASFMDDLEMMMPSGFQDDVQTPPISPQAYKDMQDVLNTTLGQMPLYKMLLGID